MIDYRMYVNMKSELYKGKSIEEIGRLLNPESRRFIELEYLIDRVDGVLSKYLSPIDKK